MENNMERLICYPTQCYNVPIGKVEKKFVLTLLVELDGIRGHKWKFKNVIAFHTVILQHIGPVTGAKIICARIDAQLDL